MTGSIIGRPLFKLLRIRSEPVCGCALGLSAHGMGTGAAFLIGQKAGLAMGVSGIISAFLAPLLALPIMHLLGR